VTTPVAAVPDYPLVLTAAEMRAADAAATDELGLPSLLLMENAGRGVAEIIRRELGGAGPGRAVVVVCGGGSNGGDGFVVARHLARAGVAVRVVLAAARERMAGDAALNLTALERMGGVAVDDGSAWTEAGRWGACLAGAAVVVDAIFGTGIRGAVSGVPALALEAMNAALARKIAVDVPSGLDADTGRAAGPVFKADVTATMAARKLGLVVDAEAPVGRIEVVDLGVPIAAAVAAAARCRLLDDAGVAARLPRRRLGAHKGSSGHLLVIAGSAGKTGAALLVGQGALRAGAGLVTLASTPAGQAALDAKVVELMTARYPGGEDAAPEAAADLRRLAGRAQAFVIGPGIPTGPGMRAVVRTLAAALPLPGVLDADALNALGTSAASVLASASAPRIVTPHPGEMSRLTGVSIEEIEGDRVGHARAFAVASRATVVLKGARTVIASPDGAVAVSPVACPALATAGSGDVLGGVIGALLARGLAAATAAEVGVFVHGRAGEELAAVLGDGVTAGDLPAAVAGVMARLGGAKPPAPAARPAPRGAPRRARRQPRPSSPKRRRPRAR
jgi:NAD(P)H-hydrate epimerase